MGKWKCRIKLNFIKNVKVYGPRQEIKSSGWKLRMKECSLSLSISRKHFSYVYFVLCQRTQNQAKNQVHVFKSLKYPLLWLISNKSVHSLWQGFMYGKIYCLFSYQPRELDPFPHRTTCLGWTSSGSLNQTVDWCLWVRTDAKCVCVHLYIYRETRHVNKAHWLLGQNETLGSVDNTHTHTK